MKNTGKIAWICGAAAVLIGTAVLLMLSSSDRKDGKTQIVIGTYGAGRSAAMSGLWSWSGPISAM